MYKYIDKKEDMSVSELIECEQLLSTASESLRNVAVMYVCTFTVDEKDIQRCIDKIETHRSHVNNVLDSVKD